MINDDWLFFWMFIVFCIFVGMLFVIDKIVDEHMKMINNIKKRKAMANKDK